MHRINGVEVTDQTREVASRQKSFKISDMPISPYNWKILVTGGFGVSGGKREIIKPGKIIDRSELEEFRNFIKSQGFDEVVLNYENHILWCNTPSSNS